MEKDLEKLLSVLEGKIPTIIEAIENEDATSEKYNKLLTSFNSSMVVYSELKNMFSVKEMQKEENTDGTNN